MYYIGSMAYDPNYLEHHGILGMKWGVRRYQNADGTLTAAGRARYGGSEYMSAKDSKKRLKRLEQHHSELQVERNTANYRESKLDLKNAKLAVKRDSIVAKGKSTEKIDKKITKSLQKAEALNTKISELDKMMKSTEAEQWKHIANLAAQGIGTTSTTQTRFYMTRGAQAAQLLFGIAGSATRTAMGKSTGDYINQNKYRFDKTGQVRVVNDTRSGLGLNVAANRNRTKALEVLERAMEEEERRKRS